MISSSGRRTAVNTNDCIYIYERVYEDGPSSMDKILCNVFCCFTRSRVIMDK